MVFLNPRRSISRKRRMPRRGAGGKFLKSGAGRPRVIRASNSSTKTTMATRRSRSRSRRRVRRNPPKMTPAMRKKIGARIRALHRAGKYRKSRPARSSKSRAVVRRSGGSVSVRRSVRRVSRRRSSGGISRSFSGGMLGLGAILSKDNLLMASGALGATFLTNYTVALITPKLPASLQNNPFVNAAIKLTVAGVTAKVVSRWSRPMAQGVLIGGALVVANDLIRKYAMVGTSGTAAQYLGGNRAPISQYLGGRPAIGPVSPTANTFSQRGMNGVYTGGSAFKSDAWAR